MMMWSAMVKCPSFGSGDGGRYADDLEGVSAVDALPKYLEVGEGEAVRRCDRSGEELVHPEVSHALLGALELRGPRGRGVPGGQQSCLGRAPSAGKSRERGRDPAGAFQHRRETRSEERRAGPERRTQAAREP